MATFYYLFDSDSDISKQITSIIQQVDQPVTHIAVSSSPLLETTLSQYHLRTDIRQRNGLQILLDPVNLSVCYTYAYEVIFYKWVGNKYFQ